MATANSKEQFICVPVGILQANLSAGAMKALMGLLSFRSHQTGQCNPKIVDSDPKRPTLCNRVGAPRRTVCRWLAELRRKGMIVCQKRRYGGGYWYEFPTLYSAKNDASQSGSISMPNGAKSGTFKGAKSGTIGGPYPLYEQKKGTEGASRRSPSQKKPLNTPVPDVPRKTATSETLKAYYEQQRRKAGR